MGFLWPLLPQPLGATEEKGLKGLRRVTHAGVQTSVQGFLLWVSPLPPVLFEFEEKGVLFICSLAGYISFVIKPLASFPY